MTDAELERLRPPHVSMGAMKVWRYARLSMFISFGCALALMMASSALPSVCEILCALFAGTFVLSVCAWFAIVAFVFLKYSLQTLMLCVFVTAALGSLIATLPFEWAFLVGFIAVLWFACLFLAVVDHDPARRAQLFGYPEKPPKDGNLTAVDAENTEG